MKLSPVCLRAGQWEMRISSSCNQYRAQSTEMQLEIFGHPLLASGGSGRTAAKLSRVNSTFQILIQDFPYKTEVFKTGVTC